MATKRILQNAILIWLDGSIDKGDARTQDTLLQLQTITPDVYSFAKIESCVHLIKDTYREKIFVVTSGFLGQHLMERIHHMAQVEFIYVCCKNSTRHRSWASQWSKIQAVDDRIEPICDLLRAAVKQSNEDLTPICFVENDDTFGHKIDLNQLDSSFMYTTLFKRILLKMEHEPDEKEAIIEFCREQYADSSFDLDIVEEFNREYQSDKAVWWYTRECFTYQMLNRALRLLESDIIIDMGFFIHDIHLQLEKLFHEQFQDYDGPPLKLYRGQGLSTEHFKKLQRSRGGLLAFNSFLSTSFFDKLSLGFAQQHACRDNMVGILFVMTVDPKCSSTPFANVEHCSYFGAEKEVLFSMHSVFRIVDLIGLGTGKRLFQVNLTLTNDDDAKLRELTDRIEEDVSFGSGWQQLGRLLMRVGALSKAEKLYLTLLKKARGKKNQEYYYSQLGAIKSDQGMYNESLRYYKKMLKIQKDIYSADDPILATSYNDIGLLYKDMGDCESALHYYNKALEILEKILDADDPKLSMLYNNLGALCRENEDYSNALTYYDKSLAIKEKTLPANHPDLALTYNNIGLVHNYMGQSGKALKFYRKALDIRVNTLPADHPLIAQSYNNMGFLYATIDDEPEAIFFYNKALDIQIKVLPPDHPDLAQTYNNMAWSYTRMEQYQDALSCFEKTLAIQEISLPPTHSRLKETRKNVVNAKKRLVVNE